MKFLKSVGTAALAGLLVAGCAKEQRRVSTDEEGIVVAKRVGMDEIRPAVTDFLSKLARKNDEGWASHIVMSEAGKPTIVFKTIQNRTHDPHFDVVRLTNECRKAILDQNLCQIIMAGTAAGEGVEEARDYSGAGTQTQGSQVRGGHEDEWSLILTGTITSDIMENDDVTQYEYEFVLELTDTIKKQLVIMSNTKFRKEKER
jgi:hypothetical protein